MQTKAQGNKNMTSQSLILRAPFRDRQLRNMTRAEIYFQFQVQSIDIQAHDIFFYIKAVPGESSYMIYLEKKQKKTHQKKPCFLFQKAVFFLNSIHLNLLPLKFPMSAKM